MLSLHDFKRTLNHTYDTPPQDTLNILDSWSEFDERGKNLKYICFELETINPETGVKAHIFKALKFLRVKRIPKGAKQSTSFMDMQTQVLSAVHQQGINLVTIIANVIKPVPEGLLYLYGVQGVSEDMEEAKRKADLDLESFKGSMMGTFRVLHLRYVTADEGLWLQQKMRSMKHLTAVRGIPKANTKGEDMGNKGLGGANLNPDSEGTLEEIITAMADYEYVIEVLSTPVFYNTLKAWSAQTQKQMTEWNGQLQGQKSLSMNLSIPMMYATSTGATKGWNKNYTDGRNVSFSQAQSYSESYSQGTGHSISHSIGQSHGLSEGTSHTTSSGTSNSVSNGLTHGLTKGTTEGVTQGRTVGQTRGETTGQTIGYTQGVSRGQSQGVTITKSNGNTTSTSTGTSTGTSMGTSFGKSLTNTTTHGRSETSSQTQSQSQSLTNTEGSSKTHTESQALGQSQSKSHTMGTSSSVSDGTTTSTTKGTTVGNTSTTGTSTSNSTTWGDSQSQSDGRSSNHTETGGTSTSGGVNIAPAGVGGQANTSTTHSASDSDGTSHTNTEGTSGGGSTTSGTSTSNSNSISYSGSTSKSNSHTETSGITESYGTTDGRSYTESYGDSYGQSSSISTGNSISSGTGHTSGTTEGLSVANGETQGTTQGSSAGTTSGQSSANSYSVSISQTQGTSVTSSMSQSASQSFSESVSNSVSESSSTSQSNSQSESNSTSSSETTGTSSSVSNGTSTGETYSDSISDGTGENWSESNSVGTGQTYGKSEGTSSGSSIGSTGAYTTGTSGSMGLGPSIGYSKSYQWVDQEVKDLLELFEYQNERLKKALKGAGAFYTYVYIAVQSQEALACAQAAAKSSWQNENAFTNPLQVLDLSRAEQESLLHKFSAFSADISMEKVGGIKEYKYATVLLPSEYVAYTHLPRVSEGGIETIVDDIPKFRVPAMMKGDIYMGTILNSERYTFRNGYRTQSDYRINIDELMHGLITGQSRSGKTVAAMRLIKELAHARRTETGKRLRIVIMDPKQDWRGIARFVEPERFNFYSLGNTHFRPINLNPCKIPVGVEPQHWIDGLVNIYCRAYGLLERGKQMMSDAFFKLYSDAGVFKDDDRFDSSTWNSASSTWEEEISRRSGKVTFHKVYKKMEAMKIDASSKRTGNDTLDAYARLMERLSCFSREFSIEYKLFSQEDKDGNGTGCGIDELIGGDDVTVFESFGLEATFANFIFGIMTSGFYKVAKSYEGGYLHPSQYETVLVIEEANKVLTGNDTAGTGFAQMASLSGQSEFEEILDQSAGYGLFVMAITQKISMMPSSIIANCGLLFLGKISQPADVDLAVRMIGREGRMEDRDVVKWLPKSPTGWFIMRSNRTFDFCDAEPVLCQIEQLNNATITNAELEEMLTMKEIVNGVGRKKIS